MAQVKKSLYELYALCTDTMLNQLRKVLPKHEKKKTIKELFLEMVESFPPFTTSLDFLIAAEEHYWKKCGSQVIFPESDIVLDSFAKAKFSLETGDGFELPFESFVLAVPNGYTFLGTKIPGVLVTMMKFGLFPEVVTKPFGRWIGLKGELNFNIDEPAKSEKNAIAISYRDPITNVGYVRMLIQVDKIPALLKASSLQEFKAIMGMLNPDKTFGIVELDDADLDIQFKVVKLIAALGVYNLATEGERLKAGFPGQSVPRMNNRNPSIPLQMHTLSSKLPSQVLHNSPEAHYRSWHIRQLRDERYYKGEYANRERGSRFVFVSDSVVGAKVTPNTQI